MIGIATKRVGIAVLLLAGAATPPRVNAQAERLLLEVDRVTGATTLSNPSQNTANIDLISYTLHSASSALASSDSRWKSFQDTGKPNWFEANPTASDLSELASSGSFLMSPGTSHDFGTPFSVNASAPIGTNRVNINDADFKYVKPDGTEVFAATQLGGRFNNLVLVVEPTSGFATLQNQSKQSIALIGYTISSVLGSLEPAYSGSGLPNWFTANPTFFNLSELNTGSPLVLGEGDEVDLGTVWFTGGVRDLTLSYQKPDGNVAPGNVFFGPKAIIATGIDGDYNGDGHVDGTDYVVWRKNKGLTGSPSVAQGNGNGDGVVDNLDYDYWRARFGITSGSGSGALLLSTVPEPRSLAFALFAVITGLAMRLRSRDYRIQD
jgi:hypothetical protein